LSGPGEIGIAGFVIGGGVDVTRGGTYCLVVVGVVVGGREVVVLGG
jgi:hypothetical protein